MPQAEFNIFLSHHSADQLAAAKLAFKLHELGFDPWVEAAHFPPEEASTPEWKRVLATCSCCVVMIGHAGMGETDAVEMWLALQQKRELTPPDRRIRIIPILLPESTQLDRTQLPQFLTANPGIEFQGSIDDPQALDQLLKALRGDDLGAGVREPAEAIQNAIRFRKPSRWLSWGGMISAVLIMGLLARFSQNQAVANNLVVNLLKVKESEVLAEIQSLKRYEHWSKPKLKRIFETEKGDPSNRLRAALVLATFPADRTTDPSTLFAYLREHLLTASAAEFPLIRDVLKSYDAETELRNSELWKQVEDHTTSPPMRFRALAALATFDSENQRWANGSEQRVSLLLQQAPPEMGMWTKAFCPVKAHWLTRLTEVFHKTDLSNSGKRKAAALALAEFCADQPDQLLEFLLQSDESQFSVIFSQIQLCGNPSIATLVKEIETPVNPELPSSDPLRETVAFRQINAAIALLNLEQPEKVWPLLKHSPDPRVRSGLIHSFAPKGVPPQQIFAQLARERDPSIRQALILSLGQYDQQRLVAAGWNEFQPYLESLYENELDPGLHSACEWLLQKFHHTLPVLPRSQDANSIPTTADQRRWHINSQGATMIVVAAMTRFKMGSPSTEAQRGPFDNKPHVVTIPYSFAVSSKLVTVAQFLKFNTSLPNTAPPNPALSGMTPTEAEENPVRSISWFEAAAYCNWLSKLEGLEETDWCYGQITNSHAALKTNALALKGYRLATEEEYEAVVRAGTSTSFCYGESDRLLSEYSWFALNSDHRIARVGHKKPNEWGIFDAHGNLFSWCNDRANQQATTPADERILKENSLMVLRGGSFNDQPPYLRSASRNIFAPPTYRLDGVGFRLARTLPSASLR